MTGTDPAEKPWLPCLSGLLAAIVVAVWTRPPILGLSFGRAAAAASFWIIATVLAGTLGLAIAACLVEGRLVFPATRLMLAAAAAWVLIPPTLLCWLRGSGWAAGLSAGAGAAMAAALWRKTPPAESPESWDPWTSGPHFADLPPPDSGRPQAFAIAVCVELAIVLVSRGGIFLATLLAGIAGFLFVSKRLASLNAKQRDGFRKPAARTSAAALLAMLILIPLLMAHFVRTDGVEARAQAAARTRADAARGDGADSYRGIVLFTVQEKKKQLPPLPMERNLLRTGTRKPLVIPFDGSYWYFQAPQHDPGLHPHLAHGDPVAVSIYSTGWVPLAMQAHQTLTQPVDLRSCAAMQVTVRNGDNRTGRIDMGVLLTDSTAPGKPSMYLGTQPILSTEPDRFTIKVNPVTDEITYTIPEQRRIRKFDEITVLFFPDAERSTFGARIGIQQFELTPR